MKNLLQDKNSKQKRISIIRISHLESKRSDVLLTISNLLLVSRSLRRMVTATWKFPWLTRYILRSIPPITEAHFILPWNYREKKISRLNSFVRHLSDRHQRHDYHWEWLELGAAVKLTHALHTDHSIKRGISTIHDRWDCCSGQETNLQESNGLSDPLSFFSLRSSAPLFCRRPIQLA